MSDSTNAKPATKKQSPVKVIRVGAIAASIWRRQTSTGLEYLDYSLSRSWKLKNGEREGYSQNFFDHNEDALCEVIRRACQYIRGDQDGAEPAELASDSQVENEPLQAAA